MGFFIDIVFNLMVAGSSPAIPTESQSIPAIWVSLATSVVLATLLASFWIEFLIITRRGTILVRVVG